ncbi:MAG: GntR family transcriptional regulator [Actinomycetia bacterium]|nr:GntR family transcriptional regulator [Actinomycetes bacterium]
MGEDRRQGQAYGPRASLRPVVREGLTDRVIDVIRRQITDGTWALHQRLPVEPVLAKELGVGRSTIREAVRVLAHAGMLEVRQGDGTYVRSRREIDATLRRRVLGANLLEAFEVRRALEIEAARLAAQHGSASDATRLVELVELRAAASSDVSSGFSKADNAFREHLIDMTGNGLFADLYRGFVDPLRAAIAIEYGDEAELTRDDPVRPECAELVQAIVDRDPEAAAAAAQRRMDNALRVLQVLLQVLRIPDR